MRLLRSAWIQLCIDLQPPILLLKYQNESVLHFKLSLVQYIEEASTIRSASILRLGRCEIRLKLLALNPSRASSSSVKQHGGQTNILCAFRADVDGAGR